MIGPKWSEIPLYIKPFAWAFAMIGGAIMWWDRHKPTRK